MEERYWEINGNLNNNLEGLKNYKYFSEIIYRVKIIYDEIFGLDIMNKYDLYIDNATENSGWAPIITPILKKYFIIKLAIYPNDVQSKIVFQFAHELTHFVFYSYFGIDKPRANDEEEIMCTAASLILIKMLFSKDFEFWNEYTKSLEERKYRQGADYAEKIGYNLQELRDKISMFKYKYSKKY